MILHEECGLVLVGIAGKISTSADRGRTGSVNRVSRPIQDGVSSLGAWDDMDPCMVFHTTVNISLGLFFPCPERYYNFHFNFLCIHRVYSNRV